MAHLVRQRFRFSHHPPQIAYKRRITHRGLREPPAYLIVRHFKVCEPGRPKEAETRAPTRRNLPDVHVPAMMRVRARDAVGTTQIVNSRRVALEEAAISLSSAGRTV